MLNEERVKQMTKMALFEKREYRDLMLAEGYRQKDYRAANRLGAFFLGTFLYFLVYAGGVAFYFYQYVTVLHLQSVLMVLFAGLVLYVCVMFFYLTRISKHAKKRYAVAHKKLETWFEEEKKLLELYAKEEQAKTRTQDKLTKQEENL